MTDRAFENTVVRGTVRAIEGSAEAGFALVEIAPSVTGRVALAEFGKPPVVAVGDEISVLAFDDGDVAVLSKEKADILAKWDRVAKVHEAGGLLEGTVVAPIKGGFSVDIGLRAFLPGRHAELKAARDPDDLVGQTLQFSILKLDDEEGRVVLSRRVLLEKEREEQKVERATQKKERAAQKQETLGKLKEGEILTGKVKTVTDYGAFIDLGGVDGLVHVTEMSWARVAHPREVVKVGDEVRVMVLRYDPATERIGLGLKQTQPDPWKDAAEKLSPGTQVSGKVTSLTDYGAFVSLAPGVEGLLHVSEMAWTRIAHPSKMMAVGDTITAVVLDVDLKTKRVRLGMRQLAENPWSQLEGLYPIGSVIRGKVRSVTDFGVFIAVQEGIDGLVHVSDLSWTQRVKHPGELYKKGIEVEAVVLDIDVPNERFSLGIKQLKPDPWSELLANHPIGSVTKGKVIRVVDFGAFVEIEPGIEGLVHVSQMRDERVENPRDVVKEGDEIQVKVIDMDPDARKVALSMRAAAEGSTAASGGGGGEGEYDYRETMKQTEQQGRVSFGDVLAGKLGNKPEGEEE